VDYPVALPTQGAPAAVGHEYRRAIALEFSGNAGKTDVLPLERVNLVPFFLGQVFVVHGVLGLWLPLNMLV